MKIAVAQISSKKGDVSANVATHLKYIEKSGALGVDYIVFPELSLTGYEPELAAGLCFSKDDKRLAPIVDSAIKHKITIGVGAPLSSKGLPKIGLIIVHPSGVVETYEKIHLHPGEEVYFDEGSQHHFLTIRGHKIANAICADANNPVHPRSCAVSGTVVYMAGVLVTPEGYRKDAANWAAYAKEHNMLVAIANYNKPTGGWPAAGRSAVWTKSGLLVSADAEQDALVVAEKGAKVWAGRVLDV